MKVLFAILLIIGYAAAISCPVLEKLETQLQKNVVDIKKHTQESIDELSTHAKEDIPAFIKNPVTGAANFIKNLSDGARNVVLKSISDVDKINQNIRSAISELKKVDQKLVKEQVYSTLNNLAQQLVVNLKNARASVLKKLQQVIPEVGNDAKALISKPSDGTQIQKKWNEKINQIASEGKQYADGIEKQIQDALKSLEDLYPPTPESIVRKLKTDLEQDVVGVKTNINQLLKRSADNDKNKVDVFIQNPPKGSGPLINDLFNDARDVMLASYSDIEKMSEHIRSATNELKQVDASSTLSSDMDSLLKQLQAIRTAAKENVIKNLDHAVTQVGTDMEKLQTPSIESSKAIKDKWNTHFDEFVVALNTYVATVEKTVQTSLGEMDKKTKQ